MSENRRTGREPAAVALAVGAVLLLLVGSLAWWARSTLYDTEVVTAKADEIAASDDVQAAAVALLVERVVQPALAAGYDAVPAGLGGFLEGIAGDKVVDLATEGVQNAVRSQQAHDITVRLAAAVQEQLVDTDGAVAFTPSEITAVVAPSLADNRVVASVVSYTDSTGCCRVVLAERTTSRSSGSTSSWSGPPPSCCRSRPSCWPPSPWCCRTGGPERRSCCPSA